MKINSCRSNVTLMFGQRSRRWSSNNINQTLGHLLKVIKMLTTFTNDHLKFLRFLFYFTLFKLQPSPMAEYFLMQILYSSSSSAGPISDICVSIGCSSTLLKKLYCQFSTPILDSVSGKKKLLRPSCIWCQWLYWRFIYCTEKVRKI